jgi:hypothetical protein
LLVSRTLPRSYRSDSKVNSTSGVPVEAAKDHQLGLHRIRWTRLYLTGPRMAAFEVTTEARDVLNIHCKCPVCASRQMQSLSLLHTTIA